MKESPGLLRNQQHIVGATVFRRKAGFDNHGLEWARDLLRFNANLPLVLEIFNAPEKIESLP